jgi:hypothetical protein
MAKSTRKNGAAPKAGSRTVSSSTLAPTTPGDIARRAYDLYLARGGQDGHDLEDWLRAERELKESVGIAM